MHSVLRPGYERIVMPEARAVHLLYDSHPLSKLQECRDRVGLEFGSHIHRSVSLLDDVVQHFLTCFDSYDVLWITEALLDLLHGAGLSLHLIAKSPVLLNARSCAWQLLLARWLGTRRERITVGGEHRSTYGTNYDY